MTKELSINGIKKEIIDKLMNNMDILKYLNTERFINEGYKISDLYDNIIFDYDISNEISGDYIAVEVAEYEPNPSYPNYKKYSVIIKFGLGYSGKKNLDKIAEAIKNIISELYPDREYYSNVPFYVKRRNYDFGHVEHQYLYDDLNRMISFKIEGK